MIKKIATLLLSLDFACSVGATDLDDARALIEAGSFAKAYLLLEPAAERGDPYSQYYLGTLFMNGLGVARDSARAFAYFRAAAGGNVGAAQYELGTMYWTGKGVLQNFDNASYWFGLAFKEGLGWSVIGYILLQILPLILFPVLVILAFFGIARFRARQNRIKKPRLLKSEAESIETRSENPITEYIENPIVVNGATEEVQKVSEPNVEETGHPEVRPALLSESEFETEATREETLENRKADLIPVITVSNEVVSEVEIANEPSSTEARNYVTLPEVNSLGRTEYGSDSLSNGNVAEKGIITMDHDFKLERSRLISLIDFSHEAARLRGKPVSTVAKHGLFSLFEDDIRGLPGVRLNTSSIDGEDEVWLSIERLHETRPPKPESPFLVPWLSVGPNSSIEPTLLGSVLGKELVVAGTHYPRGDVAELGKDPIDAESLVLFEAYNRSSQIEQLFQVFLATKWKPWAEQESLRRKTISLYAKLFTLKQELEGAIVETQLELLWGVGVGVWNRNGTSVCYPLLGQLTEIEVNPLSAALEVRPRDVDPRLELDWYVSMDNPGVAEVDKAYRSYLTGAKSTFSPFDHSTFEPLLRTAATNLDPNGSYWPNEVSADTRSLPKSDEKLKVTDTWVLFARPRTNNLYLQDLEKLRVQVEGSGALPSAISAIVRDPEEIASSEDVPNFRGLSASYHAGGPVAGSKVRDLYFPKPFNDEQVRIVQLLDVSDGVIVQGPPGTGKTHTIANVICHYLAEGKRVLVTSMKDPALAVLQEQLPIEIRPLAISLLSSQQAGMKQFEYAIQKIASDVQSLDRAATGRAITFLEGTIDGLHSKLAEIDGTVSSWCVKNLEKVKIDDDGLEPWEAAKEVVAHIAEIAIIPDKLGVESSYKPQWSDSVIVLLREARRTLGIDLGYLSLETPQISEFPDSKAMVALHHDICELEKLKGALDSGALPSLRDTTDDTLSEVRAVLEMVRTAQSYYEALKRHSVEWIDHISGRIAGPRKDPVVVLFEELGRDVNETISGRSQFLAKPVTASPDIESDSDLREAIDNLTQNRSPFGLLGALGKADQKRRLDSIRVLGARPNDASQWKHVRNFIEYQLAVNTLILRWNALASDLKLEVLPEKQFEGLIQAAAIIEAASTVMKLREIETKITNSALVILPGWLPVREIGKTPDALKKLEEVLNSHLSRSRLANVWHARERFENVLVGRSGRIVSDVRAFLEGVLGNQDVPDQKLLSLWSNLAIEMTRVNGLRGMLEQVDSACFKIGSSGAPKFSDLLRTPLTTTVDSLLPDHLRKLWRAKRLSDYLESIDGRRTLKRLAAERREVEKSLARAYRDVVVKRTWLKLSENASPSVRAALQAYLSAIQRIGKGTGKRAIRYRQDARSAASLANPAVPCWIMPHYRVSESLPAELGCFDLVVIDEASQSDLTALPALLRAKKVLIVGDDKQVSPEGVGLEEEKIKNLMQRFLDNQVGSYRPQMTPERSIYDLFKVVFARSSVMLKEHFRCTAAIIEYSKREFYNHELQPLRIPKVSERLDPPLIDVVVDDGFRKGDLNVPEASFVVSEIKAIIADPEMRGRTIGVVSLLGDKQSFHIWERLASEIGPEAIEAHQIACGDARTFQGKERDIMFLSMVAAPNEVGAPLSRETFAQRFNVAASRARDRMYLVRSVALENLSPADKLRRSLIAHFAAPFFQDEKVVEDQRQLCESPFEEEVYDELTKRGYWVVPQVKVGNSRIDMVVEGRNDSRLAIECDGDQYHGPDKWADDMHRQRILERAGWVFWRTFCSDFTRNRQEVVGDLLDELAQRGIEPIGSEGAPRSIHTEQRRYSSLQSSGFVNAEDEETPKFHDASESYVGKAFEPGLETKPQVQPDSLFEIKSSMVSHAQETASTAIQANGDVDKASELEYAEYMGPKTRDPRYAERDEIVSGLVAIILVEGPMLAKRAYDIYLRSCGIRRMGHELKSTMNKALAEAIRQGLVLHENEIEEHGYILSIVRASGVDPIKVRTRGTRALEEIPSSELQVVGRKLLLGKEYKLGSDEHLHEILDFFDLKRLTIQSGSFILSAMEKKFKYADEYMELNEGPNK